MDDAHYLLLPVHLMISCSGLPSPMKKTQCCLCLVEDHGLRLGADPNPSRFTTSCPNTHWMSRLHKANIFCKKQRQSPVALVCASFIPLRILYVCEWKKVK